MKVTTVTDIEVTSKDLMDEFVRRSRYFSDGYSILNGVVYHYERTGWNDYDDVEVHNKDLISKVIAEHEELRGIQEFLNKTKTYSEQKLEVL